MTDGSADSPPALDQGPNVVWLTHRRRQATAHGKNPSANLPRGQAFRRELEPINLSEFSASMSQMGDCKGDRTAMDAAYGRGC
jgi:hypothetical protein